jgi:hypothetical protein
MKSSYPARWGHPRYRALKGNTRPAPIRPKQKWELYLIDAEGKEHYRPIKEA